MKTAENPAGHKASDQPLVVEEKDGPPRTAFWANAAVLVVVGTMTGLGVYVNKNHIVVGGTSTTGYHAIKVDTLYWNVGCNLVGTLIGLFSIMAFSIQDGAITKHEITTDQGVHAIFLRPLTMKRGLDQLLSGRMPFRRSLLVLATAVAALTSAATVALLGVHATSQTVVNPAASYSLTGLDGTFFTTDSDGAIYNSESPTYTNYISQLSGFAYKSAYLNGLKLGEAAGFEPYVGIYTTYLPEQGMIGSYLYATLRTGGIGLNTSSYMQYYGVPVRFHLPSKYNFDTLDGSVYGTAVNVRCLDVTARYTLSDDDFIPGVPYPYIQLSWLAEP